MSESYYSTAAYLMGKTSVRPQVGIICGSGLSMLANNIVNPEVFEYVVSSNLCSFNSDCISALLICRL